MNCSKCKFYVAKTSAVGTCVIEPPALKPSATGFSVDDFYQPLVYDTDICGQFQRPMSAVEQYIINQAKREIVQPSIIKGALSIKVNDEKIDVEDEIKIIPPAPKPARGRNKSAPKPPAE